jgi:hypothetical protein
MMAENTSSRLTSAETPGSTKKERRYLSREFSANRYLGTARQPQRTEQPCLWTEAEKYCKKYSETHASHEISSTINLEQSI